MLVSEQDLWGGGGYLVGKNVAEGNYRDNPIAGSRASTS